VIPYKSILVIDKSKKQPVYLQLANQFIRLIKEGTIVPKTKIPSSRQLAELIGLHRKTIVACYEELNVQGWLETIPQRGTFVHAHLPVLKSNALGESNQHIPNKAGFQFYQLKLSNRFTAQKKEGFTHINDGINDTRLTPIQELAQIYRSICNSKSVHNHLGYGSTYGNPKLRNVLVKYLNETRGIKLTIDNILITRGSQMGIYLATQLLIKSDDTIIVGETNYISADHTFINTDAQLCRVPVDEYGIVTKSVEAICQTNKVKAVYVTSHHHHPTTKTMSAKRRLELLNLAQEYQFAIIEDDYDYDFHYHHAPILPLASHDINGHVIYAGSLCKTVAPAFRIGYLIASKDFIDEAAKIRRYIDRQGDPILESTFAKFIQSGGLNRHINKTLKVYRQRRDTFAKNLSELEDFFEFEIPSGGMAFWVKLKEPYTWDQVAIIGRKYKLEVGDWERYDLNNNGHNAIRLGFASYNDDEAAALFRKLRMALEEVE